MINHLILTVFVVVTIELFLRMDALVFVSKMIEKLSSFIKLMSSNHISDHWKEKIIPKYALIIIINALKFLGVLLLIIALFSAFAWLFDGFFQFSISVIGMVEMLLLSLFYVKIRPKLMGQ